MCVTCNTHVTVLHVGSTCNTVTRMLHASKLKHWYMLGQYVTRLHFSYISLVFFVCCKGSTHVLFQLHVCLLLCSLSSFLYTIQLDMQHNGVMQFIAKTTMYEFRCLKPGDVSETEVRFQAMPHKFPLLACQSKFAS